MSQSKLELTLQYFAYVKVLGLLREDERDAGARFEEDMVKYIHVEL